jgi:glutamate racemase
VPYGGKSAATIERYSLEISKMLLEEGAKLIVVACNTASALAVASLEAQLDVPVVGVIRPGAAAAVAATRSKRVGVIGTRATVQSKAYERAIHALDSSVQVEAQACPLLVPLIEEGWMEDPVTDEVIARYLDPMLRSGVDTLVLGCTHYPLLKKVIAGIAGKRVLLVPGQVEDDASVRLGGGDVQTAEQLLSAVRAAAPDAFIVYRPHPDVMAGNRRGMKSLPSGADAVDALTPLLQLIAMAAEVHVLTSLSGFDALLRGKRVVTYGSPFYAGWGLTLDRGLMAAAAERRSRELALDELIAGALVGYPAYLESSPDMTPSSAENVSCALGAQRQLLVRP